MKLYEINIDDEQGTGMCNISLVENPAIERNFIAFNKENNPMKLIFNDEQHKVFGPAIIPDMPIYRYDYNTGEEYYVVFRKETILKIFEKYSKYGLQNNVNIEHTDLYANATMLACFIKDTEKGLNPKNFEDLPDGTLFVEYKIHDVDTWSRIKNGELKGFSIEGFFNYSDPIEMSKQNKPNKQNETPEDFDEFVNNTLESIS